MRRPGYRDSPSSVLVERGQDSFIAGLQSVHFLSHHQSIFRSVGDAGMSAVGGWFVYMLSPAHGVVDFSGKGALARGDGPES
jgi:hypothetical protein